MKVLFRLGAAFLISFSGCVRSPYRPPETVGRFDDPLFAGRVAAAQRERESLRTFRGLYRVRLISGDEEAVVRVALAMQKPDKYRLETLPIQGSFTLNLLVKNGAQSTFLDVEQKRVARAANSAELLQRILRIPLPVEVLAGYLTGDASVSQGESGYALGANGRIITRASGGQALLQLDRDTGRPVQIDRLNPFDEGLDAAISLHGYQPFQGVMLPKYLTLQLPRLSTTLEMELLTAKINQEIPENIFTAGVPGGYTQIEQN